MFAFEPIAALSSFFLCVRMAKPTDAALRASFDALEQRTKQTRSGEKEAWLAIYREALDVMGRVAAAGETRAAGGGSSKTGASSASTANVAMNIQSTLQRVASDWTARLASQERDVFAEAERAIERLALTTTFNDQLGELVYEYGPKDLTALNEWLVSAEERWTENNQTLTAKRANEALGESALDLPSGVALEVKAAEIRLPRRDPPRLKGTRAPRPGFFQSLGASYRLVMSTVTAVSGLAFVLARIDSVKGAVGSALPVISGIAFVAAVVFASLTIPRERRQTFARLEARALEVVRRELVEAVRARLKVTSEEQRTAIQRHLAAEGRRAATLLRVGSSPDTTASFAAPRSVDLMPNDLERIRGEWREAVERRVSELVSELATADAKVAP